MDSLVGGLFQPGGMLLGACSVPRPRAGLVDWAGAPKDRKMDAVVLSEFGKEVKHKHIDLPTELAETEVLVEVHAASLSPLDCKMRDGEMKKEAPISLPAVMGLDLSGVVRKVGKSVRGFTPGDGVFGRQSAERIAAGRGGSLAEWCVVDAKNICLKPEGVSHEEAAACPTSGMTAWAALTVGGLVRTATTTSSSKKVVVIGGSGGVGGFAVQMARAYFEVKILVVVCSTARKELVLKLGADQFLDYTDPKWRDRVCKFRNFDLVIDCVGLDDYWEVFGRQVLGPSGKYVSLVPLRAEAHQQGARKLTLKEQQQGMRPESEDLGGRLEKSASDRILKAKSGLLSLVGDLMSGFRVLNHAKDVGGDGDLKSLKDLLDEGFLRPAIDSIHDLREAGKAYEAAGRGHAGGKVVVRVRRPWERESVQQLDLPREEQRRSISIPGRADADVGPGAAVRKAGKTAFGTAVPMSSLGKVEGGGTPRARAVVERKKVPLVLSKSAEDEVKCDLPDGWESAYDPDGEIYYYNRALNVSQYQYPASAAATAKAPQPPPSNAVLPADMMNQESRLSVPDVAVARGRAKADGPDVQSVNLKAKANAGTMSKVRECAGDDDDDDDDEEEGEGEEEEFDPEMSAATAAHRLRARAGSEKGGCGKEGAGKPCGLGVTLREGRGGEYTVKRMERGGPCDVSGEVHPGDLLESVDGVAVTGRPYSELAALVLGEEGSAACLVMRDAESGREKTVFVQRLPIDAVALAVNQRLQQERAAGAGAGGHADRERLVSADEREHGAMGRRQREKAERERVEREKAEREKAERERAEREKAERERAEREKAERERAERIITSVGEPGRGDERERLQRMREKEMERQEQRERETEEQRRRDEGFEAEQHRMRVAARRRAEEEEQRALAQVAQAAKEERRRSEEGDAMRLAASARGGDSQPGVHSDMTPLFHAPRPQSPSNHMPLSGWQSMSPEEGRGVNSTSPEEGRGAKSPGGGRAIRSSPMPKVLYAQPVADDIPGRETVMRLQAENEAMRDAIQRGRSGSTSHPSNPQTPRGDAGAAVLRGRKTPRGENVGAGGAVPEAAAMREAALAHARRLKEESASLEQQQLLLLKAQQNLSRTEYMLRAEQAMRDFLPPSQPPAGDVSSTPPRQKQRGATLPPPPLLAAASSAPSQAAETSSTPRRPRRGNSPPPPPPPLLSSVRSGIPYGGSSHPSMAPSAGSVPPPGWDDGNFDDRVFRDDFETAEFFDM